MRIQKQARAGQGLELAEGELAQINALSRKELKAGEVYAFGVRLCDNEIDRDGERFPLETLQELERLFVGKSGVFDHQWSALGQTARIYRTELVQETEKRTGAGDAYCYLKGYAYMLRTEKNRDLIAEIEGGIKKEVSVGCAVERAVCSICGEDHNDRTKCRHVKGRTYNGKLCWADLREATDAYEWSFVAVPAQKNAGVIKQMKRETDWEQLEREAELGRRYLAGLREEIARLGALAEPELSGGVRKQIAGKLDEEELLAVKRAYEKRLDERFPTAPQIKDTGGEREAQRDDVAFLI